MKNPRTWVKKIVCALSIFAMQQYSSYAQMTQKQKEAAAIQDV